MYSLHSTLRPGCLQLLDPGSNLQWHEPQFILALPPLPRLSSSSPLSLNHFPLPLHVSPDFILYSPKSHTQSSPPSSIFSFPSSDTLIPPSGSSSVASPSLHKHTQTHKIRDKTRGRSNGSECNEETVENKPDRTEQNQREPSSSWQMVILWAGFVHMWECVWVFITLVMVSFSSRYKKIRSLPITQSLPLIYDYIYKSAIYIYICSSCQPSAD